MSNTNTEIVYYNKYLKYKNKYNELKLYMGHGGSKVSSPDLDNLNFPTLIFVSALMIGIVSLNFAIPELIEVTKPHTISNTTGYTNWKENNYTMLAQYIKLIFTIIYDVWKQVYVEILNKLRAKDELDDSFIKTIENENNHIEELKETIQQFTQINKNTEKLISLITNIYFYNPKTDKVIDNKNYSLFKIIQSMLISELEKYNVNNAYNDDKQFTEFCEIFTSIVVEEITKTKDITNIFSTKTQITNYDTLDTFINVNYQINYNTKDLTTYQKGGWDRSEIIKHINRIYKSIKKNTNIPRVDKCIELITKVKKELLDNKIMQHKNEEKIKSNLINSIKKLVCMSKETYYNDLDIKYPETIVKDVVEDENILQIIDSLFEDKECGESNDFIVIVDDINLNLRNLQYMRNRKIFAIIAICKNLIPYDGEKTDMIRDYDKVISDAVAEKTFNIKLNDIESTKTTKEVRVELLKTRLMDIKQKLAV